LIGARGFRFGRVGFSGGNTRIGESIAQRWRSQRESAWWRRKALGGQGGHRRSQRGIGAVDAKGFGRTGWLLGGKHALGWRHRTEVTEVTEGGTDVVDERLWADRVASGWETRIGVEASHRGHGGRRGGIGVVDAKGFGWTGWFPGGKCAHWMKASHRGHGGVIWLMPTEILSVTPWLLGGEIGSTGKHRTEATEGDLGWCPENSIGKTPV
jgi:hypothetical protein